MGPQPHSTPAEAGAAPGGLGRPARLSHGWSPRPVSRDTLAELHTLMCLGPAQLDASPTRALFLTSEGAKARLAPFLPDRLQPEALAAPVCAVVGYDVAFAEQLIEFLPHAEGAPPRVDSFQATHHAAVRNGALQGAYLVIAARALGLEAVALADFDVDGVSAEFFRSPRFAATFVCSLGYRR